MKLKSELCLALLMATSAVALFPTTVKAQSSLTTPGCLREPEAYIPAGTLAMMAYRGAFEKEGIPGYGVLGSDVREGKVTGQKIVAAAVAGCVLSNKYGVAGHDQYVEDVEDQLQLLMDENQ